MALLSSTMRARIQRRMTRNGKWINEEKLLIQSRWNCCSLFSPCHVKIEIDMHGYETHCHYHRVHCHTGQSKYFDCREENMRKKKQKTIRCIQLYAWVIWWWECLPFDETKCNGISYVQWNEYRKFDTRPNNKNYFFKKRNNSNVNVSAGSYDIALLFFFFQMKQCMPLKRSTKRKKEQKTPFNIRYTLLKCKTGYCKKLSILRVKNNNSISSKSDTHTHSR